jgi:tetratricopeptide (TPR) repeat protein
MEKPISEETSSRLELWIGLFKFIIGTVVMGLVSLFLNHQYQSNQLDLERQKSSHAIALQDKQAEFDYLSTFMNHAMNEDLEVRIRLANYMQSAALSKNIKSIWRNYYDVLVEQQKIILAKRDALKKEQEQLAIEFNNLSDTTTVERDRWVQQMNEVRKEIYYLQDQLDRKKYGEYKEQYVDVYDIFRKAQVANSEANYSQALTLLKKGLAYADDSMESILLSEIASTYRAMRDFDNAQKYAEQVVNIDSKDANALFRLAIMQKNNGRIDLALATLQKAENNSHGALNLHIQLVQAGYLIHAGKRDEGMSKFDDIQGKVENSDNLASNLAWFRSVAGPKSEFYIAFERALELDVGGKIFSWIDAEVDLDPYRKDAKFIELVFRFRQK